MKQLLKYFTLFCIGGIGYMLIEISFRGNSHWTMGILGGICLILIGLINEVAPYEIPLFLQMALSAIIITLLEFLTGLLVNVYFGLAVWDYSRLPFNIMGQVCLLFSILWYFLSLIAIILDDVIRWKLFGEEKPHYTLFRFK